MQEDSVRSSLGDHSSIIRHRALDRLKQAVPGPLALVVAPAGYGKTTLLEEYANSFPGRVLRWRPSAGTARPESLLAAMARQLPPGSGADRTALSTECCAHAVEALGEPALLLVDGLDLVRGTAAEAALEEIVLLAPANLRVLAAGRRQPMLNLMRRELTDTLLLRAADLRFRSDEIARMFTGGGVNADRLYALTQGWPAALGLLHCRQSLRSDPGGLGPAMAEYIDRELLGELPAQLLSFLEQVSPLPVLTAELCDARTDGHDSAWLLHELAYDRGLLDGSQEPGTFTMPPLLRRQLLHRVESRGALVPRRRPLRGATGPALSVRCFGGFDFVLQDRDLDWSTIRPRARALLHILAMNPERPVHRELLMDSLWPHQPPANAARALQVAVSTLRTFLQPGAGRLGHQLLARSGETYLLRLPDHASSDVLSFETAMALVARSRDRGAAPDTLVRALRSALDAYGGELLPEDGPSEWVTERREQFRRTASEAALLLARVELKQARPRAAAEAAARSLAIDPYSDDAWQTLIAAQSSSGDTAAAQLSRQGHARMLLSLGLPVLPGLPGLSGGPSEHGFTSG